MKTKKSRNVITFATIVLILGIISSIILGNVYGVQTQEYMDFLQDKIDYPSLYSYKTFKGAETEFNWFVFVIVNVATVITAGLFYSIGVIISNQEDNNNILSNINKGLSKNNNVV